MQKESQYRNRLYMLFVRTHDPACNWPTATMPVSSPYNHDHIVAHHVRMHGDGGVGLKPSDYLTVPLTNEQHQRLHDQGERIFWQAVGYDPYEIILALLYKYLALPLPISSVQEFRGLSVKEQRTILRVLEQRCEDKRKGKGIAGEQSS